jgi:hypothetical protein
MLKLCAKEAVEISQGCGTETPTEPTAPALETPVAATETLVPTETVVDPTAAALDTPVSETETSPVPEIEPTAALEKTPTRATAASSLNGLAIRSLRLTLCLSKQQQL